VAHLRTISDLILTIPILIGFSLSCCGIVDIYCFINWFFFFEFSDILYHVCFAIFLIYRTAGKFLLATMDWSIRFSSSFFSSHWSWWRWLDSYHSPIWWKLSSFTEHQRSRATSRCRSYSHRSLDFDFRSIAINYQFLIASNQSNFHWCDGLHGAITSNWLVLHFYQSLLVAPIIGIGCIDCSDWSRPRYIEIFWSHRGRRLLELYCSTFSFNLFFIPFFFFLFNRISLLKISYISICKFCRQMIWLEGLEPSNAHPLIPIMMTGGIYIIVHFLHLLSICTLFLVIFKLDFFFLSPSNVTESIEPLHNLHKRSQES